MKKNSKYCSQFRTGDSKFIWFCSTLWLAEQIYLILFCLLIGWANLSDFVLPSDLLSKFIWFCLTLWLAEQIYLILFCPLIGWANLSDFVLPSDWLSKLIRILIGCSYLATGWSLARNPVPQSHSIIASVTYFSIPVRKKRWENKIIFNILKLTMLQIRIWTSGIDSNPDPTFRFNETFSSESKKQSKT